MSYKNQRNKNYNTVQPDQPSYRPSKFDVSGFDLSDDDDGDDDLSPSITKFRYLVSVFNRETDEEKTIAVTASSEYEASSMVEEMDVNYEVLDVEEDDEIEDTEDSDGWLDLDDEPVSEDDIDDDTPLSAIVRRFNRMSLDDDF